MSILLRLRSMFGLKRKKINGNEDLEAVREAVHYGRDPTKLSKRDSLAPEIRKLLEEGKIEEILKLLKDQPS